MRYTILITCYLLSLICTAQSDITSELERLAEIQEVSDPLDRDTQLIWQYSYISEELARHKDVRTKAYLDTLKTLVDLTDWDNGLGFYYRAMGRYYDFSNTEGDKALEYYQKAIDAYKPAGGDYKELAFTYVLKGFFLSNSGLHDKTFPVFEEGIKYARQTNYKNSLCLMLDWYGDYYVYGLGGETDYAKALDYYLQVNKILPDISYQRIVAGNHAGLSLAYERLGQQEKSDYHFALGDSVSEEHNLPHVRAFIYSNRADILTEKGKYEEANPLYQKAGEIMASSRNDEFKSRIERTLWENYKNIGDYKKALEHYETHISMEDGIANEDVQKKYIEIEAKYNLTVKEKELQELRATSLKNIRNLLLALVGVLLGASLLIWNKNRALKRSYIALEEKQDEIEEALYKGETQERQRVASELHDNVNTKLAAARWRIEAITEEVEGPAKKILEDTIKMMGEAYQDVRHVSHNLVPEQLENEGLIASIDNLLRKINSRGKLKFLLDAAEINEAQIKRLIYPVYNIIFELINNVMKHSDASSSTISIRSVDNNLHIKIKDDGQGFDIEKMKKGYGLRSISNRVENLTGDINVQSAPGQGTEIKITIPFTKAPSFKM